jgi:GT2 family glycosyltransferase
VVVDNGSRDDSVAYIREKYPSVHLIEHAHNKGFAGGVNAGIRWAIHNGFEFVALLNNDAVAEQDWLKHLLATLDSNPEVGIATPKFLDSNKEHFDSTGDIYTTWGLPYPRGRGEPVSDKYDSQTEIFGASGGASLYRAKMLEDIGLFDEDFFAYYEDVDLSFRAQLAGWKVRYVPTALAYHEVGATSALVKGFTTYQALKNYPWMLWKNVPLSLLPTILPRFLLAYNAVFWSSVAKGRGWPALKGSFVSLVLLPKKLAHPLDPYA